MEQFKTFFEASVKTVKQASEWALFQWERSLREAMDQAEKFYAQYKK